MGTTCFVGMGFYFGGDGSVWGPDRGDGFTTLQRYEMPLDCSPQNGCFYVLSFSH